MIEPAKRRHFLKFTLAALTAASAAAILAPAALARPRPMAERRLSLLNAHTGERFNGIYWADGRHDPAALRHIDRLLRDFRTGEVCRMDRRLLHLLTALQDKLGTQAEISIISGYRSPKTNAALVKTSNGVAKRSYHMRGMALDIAVPGRSPVAVYNAARELQAGGAGLYRKSGFVHVDVGPVRFW